MACGTALALTAGSLAANEAANVNIRHKMNALTGQELARQRDFAKKGQGVFNQSLGLSTPGAAQSQIQQGQQQLGQSINQAQAVPLSLSMPGSDNGNTAVQSAQRGLSNRAAASIGGYSNFGLQQQLKDLDANSQLGLIGSKARGSMNVLPTELQQAQQSQQGLQTLGTLLGVGGTLAGLYGLSAAPAATGVSSAQLAGLGAGYGPMTAASAASLPASTLMAGQSAWAPYFLDSTLGGLGYGGTLSTLGGL